MTGRTRIHGFRFSTLGITFGVVVVVLFILWATINALYNDEQNDEITWVG